jgi:hypothetical protein
MSKKPSLDDSTVELVKRVLAMPPKHHDQMKVGRDTKKKRETKARASSSKRRTV